MACKYFHIVNTVTPNTTANNVLLGFVNPVTIADETKVCFKLVTDIADTYADFPVLVTVNGVSTVALLDKYGNPVTASELSKCKVYKGYYGATTPHIIIHNLPVTYNCGCGNVL